MNGSTLLEQLSQHRTLSVLPQEEIHWIAAHGVLRHLEAGDILTSREGPVDGLHIVLAGHLSNASIWRSISKFCNSHRQAVYEPGLTLDSITS